MCARDPLFNGRLKEPTLVDVVPAGHIPEMPYCGGGEQNTELVLCRIAKSARRNMEVHAKVQQGEILQIASFDVERCIVQLCGRGQSELQLSRNHTFIKFYAM
jgi:hypothetical protein